MAQQHCPNCGKAYAPGDEVCRECGFVFPFSTSVLPAGMLLRSRYEIQQLIHAGGMGYVYLAKDKNLFDRVCVVKQVRDRIQSKEHQGKLEEEAMRMSRLHHQNVAMILDHFVEAGHYFLVVEYIRGKTLSEVFEERQGRIEEGEVVRWAVTICEVISYLHGEGIIHRDISPDNLMLTAEGTIKFIDFGTLRELRNVASGGTAGMGKFGFTPPEQWSGVPEARSDIFALGATVYYLLTGYLPLSKEYRGGKNPQKEDFNPEFPGVRVKNPAVTPQLEGILQKALQLEVSKRYATAGEMKRSLEQLLNGRTRRVTPEAKGEKTAGGARMYLIAAVVVLVLGAIGAGAYLLLRDGNNPPLQTNLKPGVGISNTTVLTPTPTTLPATPLPPPTTAPATDLPASTATTPPAQPAVLPNNPPQVMNLNLVSEPATIDPARASLETEYAIIRQCFQGLLGYTEDLTLKPVIAKELPTIANGGISPDGKTYTFTLREDVTWSDGNKVTAHDFEYSIKRMLSPDFAGPYASWYFGIVGSEAYSSASGKSEAEKATLRDRVAVVASSEYTLEIRLTSMQPTFLQLMALPAVYPVRLDIVAMYGDKWTEPPNIVCNGPYVISEWTRGSNIKLEKNMNYWGTQTIIDEINIVMITDANAAMAAYKNGELDIITVQSGTEKAIMADTNLNTQVLRNNDLVTYSFRFNVGQAPFNNKLVRQAIATAIDRREFINAIRNGLGHIALSWIPPGMPGYDPELGKDFEYDPVKAKMLLSQAGYPGGQGLSAVKFTYSNTGVNTVIAQFLQNQMKINLGIDVVLEPLDARAFSTAISSKQYQVCFSGWGMDYPDPGNILPTLFGTGGIFNISNYTSNAFDAVVAKASGELDEAKRLSIWSEAQGIVVSDCSSISIYNRERMFLVQPWVKGLKMTAMDGLFPGWLFLNEVSLTR